MTKAAKNMGRWFRFYEAAVNDRKVQGLPGDLFKTWVNVLCLAAGNGGAVPQLADVAFALRLSEPESESRLAKLIEVGLIDRVRGAMRPHNWETRQFQSDGSTSRVQKWREKQRTETLPDEGTDDQ